MSLSRYKNLFICELVPKREIVRAKVSQAAHNFCYNLIENDIFSQTLSMIPVFISEQVEIGEDDLLSVQKRIFPQRGVYRLLNTLWETITVWRVARSYNAVWFYNLNFHNVITFLFVRYFSRSKACVILADHTPSSRKLSLQYWLGRFLWKAHAILGLSGRSEYVKHSRFSCIPGIISCIKTLSPSSNGSPYFLFSGFLGDVTGLPLVLEVFSQLPEARLYISGRDNTGKVADFAARYENIDYVGFLSPEEYEQLLANAGCCLNFRNPNLPENRNNFPSKFLEYLSMGKPVLSTMEYPELMGIFYIRTQYNVEAAKTAIEGILSMWKQNKPLSTADPYDVQRRFSPDIWRETLASLEV